MTRSADWLIREAEEAARARLAEVCAKPAWRGPRPLGNAVARALAPILKEAGPSPNILASRWTEIVGEYLAKLTTPVRVAHGKGGNTLHLRVVSAAAPIIQHAAEHIKERVHLASGTKIMRLQIVHIAPRALVSAPRRKPLSPDQRAALARALAPVRSSTLRAALADLGEAVLTERQRS